MIRRGSISTCTRRNSPTERSAASSGNQLTDGAGQDAVSALTSIKQGQAGLGAASTASTGPLRSG
jgi:hypothetical protein